MVAGRLRRFDLLSTSSPLLTPRTGAAADLSGSDAYDTIPGHRTSLDQGPTYR